MGEYFRIMEEAENDAVLGALQVQDRTPYPPTLLRIPSQIIPPHLIILYPPCSPMLSHMRT